MSTPSSTIRICSGVKLTNDYKHTIWFNSRADQLSYFAGKVVKTFSAYTYIRKSWSLKVEATMEQARKWSYLYFQNGTGKTYFYFINNIEYLNDNTVELFIEMDVMQTYLDDFTLQPCFVEREHAARDLVGDNLIDEGLDLGELTVNYSFNVDLAELCVLIMTTLDPEATTENTNVMATGGLLNKIYTGVGIYALSLDDVSALNSTIQNLDSWGKSDAIISMWMYPKKLVKVSDAWNSENNWHKVTGVDSFNVHFEGLENALPIASSQVKNKKLFTYPYAFFYLTNNSGGAGVYHYELFDWTLSGMTGMEDTRSFKICGAISPEGNVVIYPLYYRGVNSNFEEGITLSNFPVCAWNQDVYKLWLAQNQNQQDLSLLVGGLTIAAGVGSMIATMGASTPASATAIAGGLSTIAGAGMTASGLSQVSGAMAQKKDMSIQPPQSKGNHSPSVAVTEGFQTFTVQKKSIDAYHVKMIDEFFSMYGYATKRVKIPERNCRENWTYTKTVGCHVTGDLCAEDLRKIESIFNNGVTHWFGNGDIIGDYSLSNLCTG